MPRKRDGYEILPKEEPYEAPKTALEVYLRGHEEDPNPINNSCVCPKIITTSPEEKVNTTKKGARLIDQYLQNKYPKPSEEKAEVPGNFI